MRLALNQGGIAKLVRHLLLALMFGWSGMVFAVGTGAGTMISNTATVSYSIGSVGSSANSNAATFRVDEVLNDNVTWQDTANVSVSSPDSNRVLSYVLTNTGNGSDSYALSVQNNLSGDQFDPTLVDIYLDSNGNGIFDAGTDTLYVAGSNDPVLAANSSLTVFVRNNIPASLNNGDLGQSRLTAASKTLTGVPGTGLAGAGDGGSNAVVGSSGASANATGTYVVNGATVSLVKSVVVSNPYGGSQPVTGATLTYSITVTVSGSGAANNLVITDPIPTNTTYAAGSLSLNATPLTDTADGDAGDVGASTANAVTVNLGNVSTGSPTQTISFKVIIN